MAPGIFREGSPGPRLFDFSQAPDVKGFDSGTCRKDITWGGRDAFNMKTRECMEEALIGTHTVDQGFGAEQPR